MVNEERENLRVLLNYWIAHNQDHSEEFLLWAEKAAAMGESEISVKISRAVVEMNKATALFSESLQKLNEEGK